MAGVDAPTRPALPPDGLTFDVLCRSSADEEVRPHPVTVTRDWQLVTPHNLDAERVAVALGGECPCVDLADRTLPAARAYIVHRLRLEPASIVHAENGSWLATLDAVGCCGQGFPLARDAAAHLRRPMHWARRFGTTPHAVGRLAQRLLDAIAAEAGDPVIANQSQQPRCPVLPEQDRPNLVEPYGLILLWDSGLHPEDVASLCRRLAPDGGPVATHDVLEAAYARRPAAAPAPEARATPNSNRTASSEGMHGGRRRSDERDAWLRAGVPLAAVTTILSGDAYSLNDARILALRLSRSVAQAGDLLGRWQASGLTPPVDTIVGLYWGPMVIEAPPPRALVDRTFELARERGVRATRLDAALALVRTGSPEAAIGALADPVRRSHDPYSP